MKNVLAAVVCILFFGACVAGVQECSTNWEVSTGERYGSIVKTSEKGIFWVTKEAQLVRSGDGIAVMEPWEFSVVDPTVWATVREVAATGERVKLHYTQTMSNWPWVAGTSYIVTAVQREVRQ